MKNKKYWVLWTYVANYSSLVEVDAESGEDAADKVTGFFSKDFQQKASVYVFDREPSFVKRAAIVPPGTRP
jgi:hypothetical protein